MMGPVNRSKEFLQAAEELMPVLKSIPQSVIKKFHLRFEDIINEIMETHKDHPELSLKTLLIMDLPNYIQYGKSVAQSIKDGLNKK